MQSQNKEDYLLLDIFKEQGTLLDIGANDGKTLSNSFCLIEKGWKACMVEPSSLAFERLQKNHGENKNVHLFNYAITDHDGEATFYESGYIRINSREDNISLVSTLNKEWVPRWKKKAYFTEKMVPCKTFISFLEDSPYKQFDFITIDTEGEDLKILKQMDLKALGCKVICVEHDHYKEADDYLSYCAQFGMKELARTKTNLILGV